MYEDFFKLQARPFLPAPQVDRYFPAAVIESAHQTLARCVERGEGAALLVGAAGTGKTLLCQMLDQQFRETFAVARLSSGRLATRQAMLQSILYELGLPYRGMDEGELRLSLLDFLEPGGESKGGLLLLVDEAHTLPLRLLEELRMITNLVRDGQPRVRVVLAGSPLVEERFASPKLSSFAQRLAARCYLEPMDAAETAAYVRAQFQAVGGDPDQLIDDAALRAIYRVTDGIPRLINQLCDHALILASLGGVSSLGDDAIEEAWSDLQQLPTAWNSKPAEAPAAGVIEFGDLDDADDELPEAIPFRSAPTRPLHVAAPPDPADMPRQPLRKVAEGMRALGQRGTEVELDFPEFGDLLGEQFEEEEVVLDRYPSDVEMFADVPRVSSWEGRQLGSMLDPQGAAPAGAPRPGSIPHAAAAAANVHAPSAAEPSSAGAGHEVSATGQDAFWAGAKSSPQDPDLIILEDDVTPAVAPPARRREYRQLFAKLRRG